MKSTKTTSDIPRKMDGEGGWAAPPEEDKDDEAASSRAIAKPLGRPETGSESAWRAVRSIWRGPIAGGYEVRGVGKGNGVRKGTGRDSLTRCDIMKSTRKEGLEGALTSFP